MKKLMIAGAAAVALASFAPSLSVVPPAKAEPTTCMKGAESYADGKADRGTIAWQDAYDLYLNWCIGNG